MLLIRVFSALIFWFCTTITVIFCDTPANCTYENIVGFWTFYEGQRGFGSNLNCDDFPSAQSGLRHYFRVELLFPNLVVDEYGNTGQWTLIYNQGFEISINYRKYFAFSNWSQSEHTVSSRCFETKTGWAHDAFIRDWSCFIGHRTDPALPNEVKKQKNFFTK
uniref:Cathepsin C exclusion domain-containing protein n=1 Tax=Romanomermis culicivorax TaxID=13658 RepID=A0A915K6Y1_ROMCU